VCVSDPIVSRADIILASVFASCLRWFGDEIEAFLRRRDVTTVTRTDAHLAQRQLRGYRKTEEMKEKIK
jgi:hypothetical protein